jgi:hypothetical protein
MLRPLHNNAIQAEQIAAAQCLPQTIQQHATRTPPLHDLDTKVAVIKVARVVQLGLNGVRVGVHNVVAATFQPGKNSKAATEPYTSSAMRGECNLVFGLT